LGDPQVKGQAESMPKSLSLMSYLAQ